MHSFEVWAPRAQTMEVKIGEKKIPLQKKKNGWWGAEVNEAGPGTDYLYLIDGQEPGVPDPRAQWQPNGVHAGSRVVDQSAFAWTDQKWQAPPLSSGVIYELHL